MRKDEMQTTIAQMIATDFDLHGEDVGDAMMLADRILALLPDPALAEIGRLDVANCVAWKRRHVDGIEAWSAAAKKHDAAIAAYLTSDHPPRREPDLGAGTAG